MKNGINGWPSDVNCALHYDVKCNYNSEFQPQSPSDFSIKVCNGGKVKKTGSRVISIPVEKSESKLHRGHINPVAENADIIVTYSVSGVAPPRLKRARSEITEVHLNAVDVSEICVFTTAEGDSMLLYPKLINLSAITYNLEMETAVMCSVPCMVVSYSDNIELCDTVEICTYTPMHQSNISATQVDLKSAQISDTATVLNLHAVGKKNILDATSFYYAISYLPSTLIDCVASGNHPQWTESCSSEYWPWDPGIHNRQ